MKKLMIACAALVLVGCAGVPLPPGQENSREFTQESTKPYVEAYRIIAKQMRACYRNIGLLGNGYEVQADLDSANKQGTVELYYVGITGAQKPEDSMFSRTVTISDDNKGGAIIRGRAEFCVNGIPLLLRHPVIKLDSKPV